MGILPMPSTEAARESERGSIAIHRLATIHGPEAHATKGTAEIETVVFGSRTSCPPLAPLPVRSAHATRDPEEVGARRFRSGALFEPLRHFHKSVLRRIARRFRIPVPAGKIPQQVIGRVPEALLEVRSFVWRAGWSRPRGVLILYVTLSCKKVYRGSLFVWERRGRWTGMPTLLVPSALPPRHE
jgi:hypothetical protein